MLDIKTAVNPNVIKRPPTYYVVTAGQNLEIRRNGMKNLRKTRDELVRKGFKHVGIYKKCGDDYTFVE